MKKRISRPGKTVRLHPTTWKIINQLASASNAPPLEWLRGHIERTLRDAR